MTERPKSRTLAPLSDAVIAVVARMVDDGQTKDKRQPSHTELDHLLTRAGIREGYPTRPDQPLGKAKRVRGGLSWALEHNEAGGERFVAYLVGHLRGVGGFRADSPNYIGTDVIVDARDVFKAEGFDLAPSGELAPVLLDALSAKELVPALRGYIRRAQRGAVDAALVTGTGKDLLEATAAHVLVSLYGAHPTGSNFPALLGQAFTALGLTAIRSPTMSAKEGVEFALYELGIAVNRLRNREGTGHGRPFLSTLSADESKAAVQSIGVIAERLLDALAERRR